ncbi:MAG: HEAT repeat domain-containing protein [Planctomycetota bacterium]|jgi:HEAT repeat protein
MSEGLATTFRVLAKTENEAAVRVLTAALDSSHTAIQEGALGAILARRSPAGGRELLRRLHAIPQRWKEIIRQNQGRMTRSLRDAVLGTDRQMFVNACRAAVWFREYDLIPALLNLLEDPHQQNADKAGETLLELTGELYEELAAPRDYSIRRDPQLVRQHVVGSLEASVKRFDRHKRREAIEAFLLLVGRDNATLKQILGDPHHAGFLVTVDVLSHSPRGGVMRLLLSLLDDPHVPSAAVSVAANRGDLKFVRYLLRKIGREPSSTVARNLKHIESIAWLHSEQEILGQLDDAAQHAAVQLVIGSGIPRLQAFSMIEYLVLHGNPGGRRAAAEALAEFSGAEANNLVLRALDDPDPQVQAAAVAQLRRRGIVGSLARLVALVDSPHEVVRNAARENLDEFTIERFLRAFDMLEEEVRQSTGMLVKKIDLRTIPQLEVEMKSRGRTRRLRGLAIAQNMGVVEQLEPLVIQLLQDEDHLVRVQAAAALARCTSTAGRRALQGALGDRSEAVREAAQKSLAERAQFTQWRESLSDSRD